jgi:predicted enzyme related to lactoylglutathione lyase
MQPFDVPEVGRITMLLDPQGAAIGIFKPKV